MNARLARLRAACAREDAGAFLVRDTSNIRWLTGFDGVFDEEDAHALLVTPDAAVLHTDSRYAQAARAAAAACGNAVEVDDGRMSHAAFAVGRVRDAAARAATGVRAAAGADGAARQDVLGIEDAIALAEYRQLQEECAKVAGAGSAEGAEGADARAAAERDGAGEAGEDAAGAGFGGAAPAGADAPASAPAGAPAPGDPCLHLRETASGTGAQAGRFPSGPRLRLHETTGVVLRLRAVKDAGEVARLRAAQAVTDAAFAHIAAFVRPGMTERAVQVELEDFMRRHGADDVAFPSIVATGANAASPHAVAGDTVLEAGQCVVLDFGAKVRGYCSDMTRVVFLGEPDARLRSAYEVLRRANEEVERALRPGATGREMHELAERVLEEGGFGGRMGHGLGHGVGLDIHELPNLSPRNADPLVAGNVVTVEPGIYVPGEFGMRLEDFGVLAEGGFQVFTQSTHDMVII